MKVTVFNGSPRAEQSNTNIIAQAFLEGAKSAGAEVENVFLIHQDIHHCTGCFTCWFKTPGQCILKDDMETLIEKYMESDVICFASPVYTWNMTAALKNFVDRLIPLVPLRNPAAMQSNGRDDMETGSMRFPDSVIIANCGFPGDHNFETIREVFKSCNPVLEIYRNTGHILKSDQEEIKAKVAEYLDCVKRSGFELVKNGKVSENTERDLQMDLVSADDFMKKHVPQIGNMV